MASSPDAREASGPPALGAGPIGSEPASSRPEPYVLYAAGENVRLAWLDGARSAFPTAAASDVLPA
eukprot:11481834-Alexandrium_andersonii.AAC.1